MRVAILSDPPDLSSYLGEIFNAWGLVVYDLIRPDALTALEPAATLVVCPASEDADWEADALLAYARRGGTVICFRPGGALAAAAGLTREGPKECPLRLRITQHRAAGV